MVSMKKCFFIILLFLIVLSLTFVLYHNISIGIEKNTCAANFGDNLKMVTVDDKKISCYVQGAGNKTIVLLSGYGTPSPIANFMPLANKLSENYKVITIEYFGYGFSDDVSKNRTNEDFVEEIRGTLKELKIEPPYILMPHSFSGIYAMHYANEYPDEIEAIIELDASKPNQMKDKQVATKNFWNKIKSFVGIYRIIDWCKPTYMEDMFFKDINKELYNDKLLELMHKDFVWHYDSTSSVNEENMAYKNASELFDVKYPESLPVLSIICSRNAKNESLNWVKLHEEVFSNPDIQKIEILEGRHYIFYTQLDAICSLTNRFLTNT